MSKVAFSLSQLFYRGETQSVLSRSVDSVKGRWLLPQTPAVIGALVFTGRLDEAEIIYRRFEKKLSTTARVEAGFYLGIGFCRHSHYEKSRGYFMRNAKAMLTARNPKVGFFAFQGLGFYRFFSGRFPRALVCAKKAFAAAIEADFVFGKAFGAELMAHCQVQIGEVASGLQSFEEAVKYAKILGDGGLARSFSMAATMYKAQHGIEPEITLRKLETLSAEGGSSFDYSRVYVLLELARQYILRGDLEKARNFLNQASPMVYRLKHRRCTSTLYLRYSSLLFAQGDYGQALQHARSALVELDKDMDRALEVEALGMEEKILKRLGLMTEARSIGTRLRVLSAATGKAVAAKILLRTAGQKPRGGRPGEDPLGDLMDSFAGGSAFVESVLHSGYLGLLKMSPATAEFSQVIYIHPSSDGFVVFDRGSVMSMKDKVTPLMKNFLRILAEGTVSKEYLVRSLWGYQYHCLRHDPLVYRLASRVRSALGSHAHWIQITERGEYKLHGGVEIKFENGKNLEKSQTKSNGFISSVGLGDELNYRQVLILRHLRKNEFLDVRTCKSLLGVSEVTARRDLVHLLRLQRVKRLGKGRAVRYSSWSVTL